MSHPLQNVTHLLVDLDGTLVSYRDLPVQLNFIVNSVSSLRKYTGWKTAVRALRATHVELRGANKGDLTNDVRAVSAFSKKLGKPIEEGKKIFEDVLKIVFPSLRKHFSPAKGAKDFLEWAKSKYHLTLATNPVWPVELIRLRVEWAGLNSGDFKFITDASQMHACKPEPKYYQEILSKLGVKAENCLLIGNEVDMDLPATKNGIKVFLVTHRKRLKTLPKKAKHAQAWMGEFSHLQELLEEARQ